MSLGYLYIQEKILVYKVYLKRKLLNEKLLKEFLRQWNCVNSNRVLQLDLNREEDNLILNIVSILKEEKREVRIKKFI